MAAPDSELGELALGAPWAGLTRLLQAVGPADPWAPSLVSVQELDDASLAGSRPRTGDA